MQKDRKCVFVSGSYDEIEALSKMLARNGIENELGWFLGKRLIYVSASKYLECLEMGTKLGKEKGFTTISWVNAYNERRPFGYIPLMYGIVSKTIIESNIEMHISILKKILRRNIFVKYNGVNDALEILVEADLGEYEALLEKCKTINEWFANTPFESIMYFEKGGKLIQSDAKAKTERTGITSYFYQSMFYEGLQYPKGDNNSPKTCDDIETTGFKSGNNSWGLRKFDVTSEIEDSMSKVFIGNFEADVYKEYDRYWDAETSEVEYLKLKRIFVMADRGDFHTQVTIENEKDIMVDTIIKNVRETFGINYDGVTIRDSYFGNNNHENSKFDIKIREYFKMIDSNKLVHYSDSFDYVEIYDLPNGWNIIDGLDKLDYPSYTDIDKLKNDSDYPLIKNLMNKREIPTRVLTPKKPK